MHCCGRVTSKMVATGRRSGLPPKCNLPAYRIWKVPPNWIADNTIDIPYSVFAYLPCGYVFTIFEYVSAQHTAFSRNLTLDSHKSELSTAAILTDERSCLCEYCGLVLSHWVCCLTIVSRAEFRLTSDTLSRSLSGRLLLALRSSPRSCESLFPLHPA